MRNATLHNSTETPTPALNRSSVLDIVFVDDLAKGMRRNRTTIWRWIQRGEIDPPYRFGSRAGWTVEYIKGWIASRPRMLAPEQPDALKPHSVKGQPRREKKAATEPQAVTA